MRNRKKRFRRLVSAGLVLSMVFGMSPFTGSGVVEAQQTVGTAPFINTWLVAGPFDEAVADVIYGNDGNYVSRPSDGNWARVAEVSASSTWQTDQIGYPGNSPSLNFTPDKAIDGDIATAWVSQTHNSETGGPESWPAWDPQPTFYLDWKQPITVKKIETFGRGGAPEFTQMLCVLKDKDGGTIKEQAITQTGADTTGELLFDTAVEGVYHMEIIISYEGKPASICGVGFTEINVFDTDDEQEGESPERPADGNWAGLANVTANSVFNGNYLASNAIDGNTSTEWASLGADGQWPKTLTLEWDTAITVKQVDVLSRSADTADNDYDDVTKVTCELFDEEGTLLANAETGNPTATELGTASFENPVSGVRKLVMTLDGKQTGNIGFKEVYVWDGQGVSAPERPEDGNWASTAKVEANSVFSGSYPATNVIDGNVSTEWASKGGDGILPKTLTLSWDYSVEVKRIEAFSRYSDTSSDYVDSITCRLYDAGGTLLKEAITTDPKANTVGFVEFDELVTDVRKIELILNGSETGNIGLREVYVLDGKGSTPPEPAEPLGDITPKKGEAFGAPGGTEKKWEYFDDRIWNRTYDDYQDLYGYFTVKKGLDTRNKYVFAHTYVYSPEEQVVQLRAGATGSYRLFVNDAPVTSFSKPSEVQKDMTIENVVLKQGWNKLLIEIHHTFTEDLNGNGIPIARDANVSYLGFYARFTDRLGGAVDNLAYSVEGETDSLQIVSGGLESDDVVLNSELKDGKLSDSEWDRALGFGMGLPTNTMPVGYKEWPYVWNKSTTNNVYGLSASAFQFQAAGGNPGEGGYTWKIVKGELPKGLELTKDGQIADGLVDGMADLNSDKGIISIDCPEGYYSFTVRVTDADGNTAEKEFTIQVKERPNKWFEEGGVSALSHHIVMPNWYVDPNFSTDRWAEQAKLLGHTLVSIEALQQDYYWPSKFMDPNHYRHMYSPMDENGQIVETLKSFEESVKRYGMQFGLYYATEGGGLRHDSSDVFIQNVSELIQRYDPVYLYFDGPQALPWVNFDAMYSAVRNYSDEIIINSNAWGEEYGDPDLGTIEASAHYSNPAPSHFVKKVVFEPWKGATFPGAEGGYYPHKRNDYRLAIKEMVTNIGRGYSDNFEMGPGTGRGSTWDSAEVMAEYYAPWIQRNKDVRDDMAEWFAPEGLPDRHESTTGTTPYFLEGYGYEDDGKGNYENFAHPNANIGPRWGYAVSRDNNIYLHIIKAADGKIGFDAITDKQLEIGPMNGEVLSVSCLNTGKAVSGFSQDGDTLTIDLTNVEEDPVDTIIKITTDYKERKYTLTNLYLEGNQLAEDLLQIEVEGQMTFPALKADLEKVTFKSGDITIATVDDKGIVKPGKDGTTEITVTGVYEGVTVENSIKVTSKDNKIYIGEKMLSAVLSANGLEAYGELTNGQTADLELNGRAETGGPIGLGGAKITWHAGTVDFEAGDDYVPIVIEENDIFTVKNNVLIPKTVESKTRAVVWADVELDGVTVTSNRVYFDLLPYDNLAQSAEVTVSENSEAATNLTDGVKINGMMADASKWSASADGESWIQFDFGVSQPVDSISITFNSKEQNSLNSPKNYDIQISNDGEMWETVSTHNGPGNDIWMNVPANHDVNKTTQYLRLRFYGGANNGSSVDIVEVAAYGVDATPSYTVTVPECENGSVSVDKITAKAGEKVTITVTPDEEYQLKEDSLQVNEGAVEVTDNGDDTYSFIMPGENVVISAEFEKTEEPVEVKKELLQKTYKDALNLSTEGATDAAREVFEKAMQQAKAVLDNPEATQEEVNAAWDDLLVGIWGLGVVKGDKTYLQMVIDKAESMIPDEEKYVAANWQKLVDELAEAKAVYNDGNALAEDIDPAVEELLEAILMQRYKANKSNLEELIRKAEAMDLSTYTEESVAVFGKALAKARAVLADESLSVDDQNEVEQATKELNDAINQLVKESSGEDNQGEEGSDNNSNTGNGGTENDGSSNNGGNADSGKDDGKSDSTGKDSPKTGDTANITIWMIAMLVAVVAAAGVTVLVVKRRKGNM